MSWKAVAARSSAAPETAILNLRGSQLNSGCSVDHWRKTSHQGRGSSSSSLAAPAKRIGGDVAHAIAARLDAMHLDVGERAQDLGHVDQLHPVELQILPRGEMAVAAVEAPARSWRAGAAGGARARHREWRCAAYRRAAADRVRCASRSGRNSSSVSLPASRRSTCSRNCDTRSCTKAWSNSS